MKLYIGENPKTGKMEVIEVNQIDDPLRFPASPESVILIDKDNTVWGWFKNPMFAIFLNLPPAKGNRLIGIPFKKWFAEKENAMNAIKESKNGIMVR